MQKAQDPASWVLSRNPQFFGAIPSTEVLFLPSNPFLPSKCFSLIEDSGLRGHSPSPISIFGVICEYRSHDSRQPLIRLAREMRRVSPFLVGVDSAFGANSSSERGASWILERHNCRIQDSKCKSITKKSEKPLSGSERSCHTPIVCQTVLTSVTA